jgi:hypothetical protein
MRQPLCPQCNSDFVRRTHRSLLERLFSLLSIYPFRCRTAGGAFAHSGRECPTSEKCPQRQGAPEHATGQEAAGSARRRVEWAMRQFTLLPV